MIYVTKRSESVTHKLRTMKEYMPRLKSFHYTVLQYLKYCSNNKNYITSKR